MALTTLSLALDMELQHWTGPVVQLFDGVPEGEARLASGK